MSDAPLRPEFSLLADCCRWNFKAAVEAARPEIPQDLDWGCFCELAERHRVQGLAWNALAQRPDLPAEAKTILGSEAKAIAATNLAIAAECRGLLELFEASNKPLLFIKGLTVAALGYRSPLLKMGWDIDLLIDPGSLGVATQLLEKRGFELRLPSSLSQLHAWHASSKESVWDREGSLFVELHTRLADNVRLIAGIDVHSPRQIVEVCPGIALPTLAEDELFAYLAVHGASSAWFRLKWISDFAALICGRSGADIERLYHRSQQLGAGRAAGQALLLANRLFGVLRSLPSLEQQLAADRPTRLLFRSALRMLAADRGEPTERRLGTFPIHWTQFLLRPGLGYKLSELLRQGSGIFSRPAQ